MRPDQFAAEVQGILATQHGIRSELHANEDAAVLFISTRLSPWIYPKIVQWQHGESPTRPGHPAMTRVSVAVGPGEIARRIAERYRQIRRAPVR